MATRNQTALFRKYRSALQQVRPGSSAVSSSGSVAGRGPVIELTSAPLLNSRGGAGYNAVSMVDPDAASSREGVVTIGLPPAWVDISEEVAVDMQKARSKLAELVKAHGKALMPTFDDKKGKGHEQNIEVLTQEITRLLKKCEKRLQKLSEGQGSNEDMKLRKNVQRSLATDLQSLSLDFRKHQKLYLQRLQQQDEHTGGPSKRSLIDEVGKRDEDEFFDPGFSNQQMARMKKAEIMTEEREKEVKQILESVNDLAQIMRDLSVLVIDQGTIVDRIDYNIQNVAASVEQGVRELEKAERTQRKGGMVMCVMVLIALCLFMIFVLIIKKLAFG